MALRVEQSAARTTRTLLPIDGGRRPEPTAAAQQFWRRLIFSAVVDAKKTRNGIPTDSAILARWWIVEHRPDARNREEWERSFGCACERLGRDAVMLRDKLVQQIDAALAESYAEHVQSVVYVRKAMVLSCAGLPRAIARQYLLPLVDEQDFEEVAGIDHGDQYAMYDQREEPAA